MVTERRDCMNFVEAIVLDIVLLLFPLLIYLIYLAYKENFEQKEKSLFLELALFSSLYLIMRFGIVQKEGYLLILYNIPLLISYFKTRKITPIILSVILIWHYVAVLHFNFLFVFLEYVIYYGVYVYILQKKMTKETIINTFVLLKAAILSFQTFCFTNPQDPVLDNFLHVLMIIVIFYVVSYIVFYLLKKGEEIMDLNSTIKELEKEKTLRASLFKITHEIKNPIAVCKGYLDMLDLNNEEKTKKYIPIVKQEIARTLTLMDDYLDYTKIKIEKDEVDLYMLLEDTCDSLEYLFKQNKIKTDFRVPDDELYLSLDYNRIKQVLVNLFKNALEAKVDDREMVVRLSVKKDKHTIKIMIQDNGMGMDEETLSKVSEMFYTTKQKGSGLGVSLSKEIVELHGGTLTYQSIYGKGTKAIVSLPLNQT